MIWRRSTARAAILDAMPDDIIWHYGLDLKREVGIRWGLFYPALGDLERDGAVIARWENGPPPRRRMYRRESLVAKVE